MMKKCFWAHQHSIRDGKGEGAINIYEGFFSLFPGYSSSQNTSFPLLATLIVWMQVWQWWFTYLSPSYWTITMHPTASSSPGRQVQNRWFNMQYSSFLEKNRDKSPYLICSGHISTVSSVMDPLNFLWIVTTGVFMRNDCFSRGRFYICVLILQQRDVYANTMLWNS